MARYLVTLSLGPVQSLIEAARRTRDLWCGSWLLAESAKAAARVLHQQQPGCLIFPCPVDPESELAPQERPGDKEANIANILRAEVDLPDAAAVRALDEGLSGVMVSLGFPNVSYVNLEEVAGRMKAVPPDSDTLQTGRDLGVCFGD